MSSIYHIKEKIKGLRHLDNSLILYILIVILVSIGSFYLGRMSILKLDNENISIVNNKKGESGGIKLYEKSPYNKAIITENTTQGRYVASKNGKLYYRIGCGSSGRIKEENKVFFGSTQEAESAGFQPSVSCTP